MIGLMPICIADVKSFIMTLRGVAKDETSKSTYTHSNVDVGEAYEGRLIRALVMSCDVSQTYRGSATSVTIGGISAVKKFAYDMPSGHDHNFEIWEAVVPTGTTASVVAAYGEAKSLSLVALFTVVGGGALPYDSGSSYSTTALSPSSPLVVDCPAGGYIIGGGISIDAPADIRSLSFTFDEYGSDQTDRSMTFTASGGVHTWTGGTQQGAAARTVTSNDNSSSVAAISYAPT